MGLPDGCLPGQATKASELPPEKGRVGNYSDFGEDRQCPFGADLGGCRGDLALKGVGSVVDGQP